MGYPHIFHPRCSTSFLSHFLIYCDFEEMLFRLENMLFVILYQAMTHGTEAALQTERSINDVLMPHACAMSGMCSLHQNNSYFVGPVRSNTQLRFALTTLAYKNEIIIALEFRAASAVQFLISFQVKQTCNINNVCLFVCNPENNALVASQ